MVQQQPDPGQQGWSSLFSVPVVVARQLKGEPLLLTCIGVAVLLTIIGLFGPTGGALYAWLLAGLTVVFGITWTWVRLVKERVRRTVPGDGGAPARERGSNVVDLPGRADLGPVRMRARGSNSLTGGRRTRIDRLDMESGLAPDWDLIPDRSATDGQD